MKNKKKSLSILGSTGSIGRSTLDVVSNNRDLYSVEVLAAGSNIDLLEKQVSLFSPKLVAIFDKSKYSELKQRIPNVPVVCGMEGLIEAASYPSSDMVVSAITGAIGIRPTIAAINAGKDIALANKEVLVAAGELVMNLAKNKGVKILPVDSEHSAIFQCIGSSSDNQISRIILTASGGPFFKLSKEEMRTITVENALKHPTWSMGAKITIDSSTLMNKGLEVIEAHHLFNIPVDQIDVIIHPQSIIHSMVEFIDGSMLSQMSEPSMHVPIQVALSYPYRYKGLLKPFDFSKHHSLEFIELEKGKFICLDLAYEALKQKGSLACFLNAANEVLVERFLNRQISWLDISTKLEKLCSSHKLIHNLDLDAVFEIDADAREQAQEI
ncbi:MAG: 1-deoxy-D-xylulose-5-phosphate reductoisomerase [Chlamydiae bacterium]|nr:1-deoxy-D-xylulose-5-phosphate reductoisomerase [Chlamydiota bacterium]